MIALGDAGYGNFEVKYVEEGNDKIEGKGTEVDNGRLAGDG